jgi:DNA-binding IclR family transcriptional regulator
MSKKTAITREDAENLSLLWALSRRSSGATSAQVATTLGLHADLGPVLGTPLAALERLGLTEQDDNGLWQLRPDGRKLLAG